jgi:hypothetical protein
MIADQSPPSLSLPTADHLILARIHSTLRRASAQARPAGESRSTGPGGRMRDSHCQCLEQFLGTGTRSYSPGVPWSRAWYRAYAVQRVRSMRLIFMRCDRWMFPKPTMLHIVSGLKPSMLPVGNDGTHVFCDMFRNQGSPS